MELIEKLKMEGFKIGEREELFLQGFEPCGEPQVKGENINISLRQGNHVNYKRFSLFSSGDDGVEYARIFTHTEKYKSGHLDYYVDVEEINKYEWFRKKML